MAKQKVSGRSLLMARSCAIMTAAMLGLSACATSSLPESTDFPASEQQRIESAGQWQMIAADMWDEVSGSLKAGGYNEATIGLESASPKTQFTTALDSFLFTEIVSHGVAVTPDSPFTLAYSVQIVHYVPEPDSGIPAASPDATAYSGWSYNESTTELVLTVSVTDGHSVRLRRSKVYYIDDTDAYLYEMPRSAEANVGNAPLVASNWYASNPHDAEPIALHELNQFALMIDPKHGPIRTMDNGLQVAAAHCGKVGKAQAKFIGKSYPTNDRSQIRVLYECL